MSQPMTEKELDLAAARLVELRRKLSPCYLGLMASEDPVQLPLGRLEQHGLLRMPVQDFAWSGGVFRVNADLVPVLNTAIPRVQQEFAAWQLLYEVLFGTRSRDVLLEAYPTMENLHTWCFASLRLEGVPLYFARQEGDFLARVFRTMAVYRAPLTAVLLRLYEHSQQTKNETLKEEVRKNFSIDQTELPQRFRDLGLDDALVQPSRTVDLYPLRERLSDAAAARRLEQIERELRET